MSVLKSLFGPSREEIWRQLSREVGGQFHDGGLLTSSAVQARTDDWIITLDTLTTNNASFTRLRAPYFNPEGFRFEIYRAGIFSDVAVALGMQDIEVGHRRFDRDFVIKGNTPRRIRRLFDNEKIRRLIDALPKIHLSVKGHEGWLSKFPEGMDALHFQTAGRLKDLAQLRTLFELFAEVLQQLCHEGKAYEDDVRIHIRRLRAPGGQIKDKYILWEGDQPRRDAAAALGRLRDPLAVPALTAVLEDKDTVLVARAIEALTEIGYQDAIGPLVRRLGDTRAADGKPVRQRVAEALRVMGHALLADAVLAVFGGDFRRLQSYEGPCRAEIIEALLNAVTWREGTYAARALAEFHAVEALPRLRGILRRIGKHNPTGEAVAAAIRTLEARASLPRAAAADDVNADTLPRAARDPGPDPGTLPRHSHEPKDQG